MPSINQFKKKIQTLGRSERTIVGTLGALTLGERLKNPEFVLYVVKCSETSSGGRAISTPAGTVF